MKLMLNGKEVTGMGHYVMAGDIKDATAEDSNVLSGKSYYNNNGKREGTMPTRGGMSAELAAGGGVSILEGYHNGEGVVRAQDLASQTQGTAAAANIEAGHTAWVNGEMVEGTAAKGKQVKSEEVTNLGSNSLSVDGLPFTPEGILVVLVPQSTGSLSASYPVIAAHAIKGGNCGHVYAKSNASAGQVADLDVTFGTNSVSISTTGNGVFGDSRHYRYVVWGE